MIESHDNVIPFCLSTPPLSSPPPPSSAPPPECRKRTAAAGLDCRVDQIATKNHDKSRTLEFK